MRLAPCLSRAYCGVRHSWVGTLTDPPAFFQFTYISSTLARAQGVLTVLNLALGDWLADLSPVLRTLTLATLAVPIVIYGLMPQLHRLRVRLLTRATAR